MKLRKTYDVVVVDPDDAVRDGIKSLLGSFGLRVHEFCCADAFLKAAAEVSPGCVLIESELPDRSAIELLKLLRWHQADAPVIIMTSSPDAGFVDLAIESGANAVLPKPIDSEQLLGRLESILVSDSGRSVLNKR